MFVRHAFLSVLSKGPSVQLVFGFEVRKQRLYIQRHFQQDYIKQEGYKCKLKNCSAGYLVFNYTSTDYCCLNAMFNLLNLLSSVWNSLHGCDDDLC